MNSVSVWWLQRPRFMFVFLFIDLYIYLLSFFPTLFLRRFFSSRRYAALPKEQKYLMSNWVRRLNDFSTRHSSTSFFFFSFFSLDCSSAVGHLSKDGLRNLSISISCNNAYGQHLNSSCALAGSVFRVCWGWGNASRCGKLENLCSTVQIAL